MDRTEDDRAREGLALVTMAARVVPRGRLSVEDLKSVGHEELTVALALYAPDCGPFRDFIYARLCRAMQKAARDEERKLKTVPIDKAPEPVDGAGPPPDNETLTVGEVIHLTRCSRSTVHRWIDTGLLRGYRIPGSKHRRVLRSEFVAFCREYELPVQGVDQWQCE